MPTSRDWSLETEQHLLEAGWTPNRCEARQVEDWRDKLEQPQGFRMTACAKKVLEEFGGIRLECEGAGLGCARGSVHFDPTLALGEEDRFRAVFHEAGREMFPLGEAFGGHAFVGIDAEGRVYLIDDDVRLLGDTVYRALDSIVLGRLPLEMPR